MFESAHPYADNLNTYEEVSFAGASAVEIMCDPASSTEGTHDYMRFFTDNTRTLFFGLDKYHGGRGGGVKVYPGVGATASLIIPAASFVLHFHSDGSNNDWGATSCVRCPRPSRPTALCPFVSRHCPPLSSSH